MKVVDASTLEELAKVCDELANEFSVDGLAQSVYKLIARNLRSILLTARDEAG